MLDKILGDHPDIQRLQTNAARFLARLGFTPNFATLIAVATGILAGMTFADGNAGLGILLLAISATMDALDGAIARESARPTLRGGVSDLVADRLVESAVIIGIAWPYPILYLPALLLVASWYVNITVFLAVGAALERRGPKLIEYPPGILERTEALLFFAVLGAIMSIGFLRPAGPILCYAMTALELATGAQRFLFGWRSLDQEPP
ncbi:MAG TPA: CDP-alcohol phosphatidyltransferase family protein [Candidatus Binataceae bacterium]|nr:CDP-alcohol phosphatidyltransferase family protein [Candidatus Binataceae bacterium]